MLLDKSIQADKPLLLNKTIADCNNVVHTYMYIY